MDWRSSPAGELVAAYCAHSCEISRSRVESVLCLPNIQPSRVGPHTSSRSADRIRPHRHRHLGSLRNRIPRPAPPRTPARTIPSARYSGFDRHRRTGGAVVMLTGSPFQEWSPPRSSPGSWTDSEPSSKRKQSRSRPIADVALVRLPALRLADGEGMPIRIARGDPTGRRPGRVTDRAGIDTGRPETAAQMQKIAGVQFRSDAS